MGEGPLGIRGSGGPGRRSNRGTARRTCGSRPRCLGASLLLLFYVFMFDYIFYFWGAWSVLVPPGPIVRRVIQADEVGRLEHPGADLDL